MMLRLLLLVTALSCWSSNLLAQHSDVEFGYDNTASPSGLEIVGDAFTQDGILLFESSMEELDPFAPGDFSADQPGFATGAKGQLVNSDDEIWISALDASVDSAFGVGYINFYNPVTDALEAAGRIALEDNTASTLDLVLNGGSIESGVNLQFIDRANGAGSIHDHIVFELLDDATAPIGAYGVLVQLQSDFAPIDGYIELSSEPFWIVFNHGMSEADFEQFALPKFGLASFLVLGDANDDGVFNNSDIAAFVLALTNTGAFQAMFPDVDPDVVLDMNGDGVFDNGDIASFVAALTGG